MLRVVFVRVVLWLPALLLLLVAAAARAASCEEPSGVRIWWSPELPVAGERLRLLAVAEGDPGEAQLVHVRRADSEALPTKRRSGPPHSFDATIATAPAGKQRIELRRGERVLGCRTITVLDKKQARPSLPVGPSFWISSRVWDRATEGLYAAWIEALFDAPPGEALSFRPLAPALRDPERNFLHGHRGLREDDAKNKEAIPAEPDCADLPYFLRAYFAWKMGLPFGFRDCDRGRSEAPPKCGAVLTNEAPATGKSVLAVFRQFLRKLGNTAHSGSARTALGDEATDLYPVALDRASLRPGTVYADPYGHVLMIAKWVAQGTEAGGLLLAVDGQPDGSIARKRFWEGTFLFASDEKSAGPGFKAFRPLVRDDAGVLGPMANAALTKDPRFARFSREQEGLSPEVFYANLGRLINPRGLDPKTAYEETLSALIEQLETRIGSVDNGESYMQKTPNALVAMPEGRHIFETVGPWEDYATPSRDMRLIIAMKVLQGLPERIVRHPELYMLAGRAPAEVRKEIEALHERRARERSIEYRRSDGSAQRLTVAELMARKPAFEGAYNPNDCVEIRWGAAPGSPEGTTCKRRAPADQQARMDEYRAWFREARRPPR